MSCDSNSSNYRYADFNASARDALSQWARYSDDMMNSYLTLGRKLMATYMEGVQRSLATLPDLPDFSAYSKLPSWPGSCDIPTTDCPPYCICELRWEACEGEKLVGYVEIKNTGDDNVQFHFAPEAFRNNNQPTEIKAQVDKPTVPLKPNESEKVTVTVNLSDHAIHFDSRYYAEMKVIGRYEQCVKLEFTAKRKSLPYCFIEHGEIPTRIVPHHWYHHFQCEELCFKPVRGRVVGTNDTLNSTVNSAVLDVKRD
jgi:hypothetical protein